MCKSPRIACFVLLNLFASVLMLAIIVKQYSLIYNYQEELGQVRNNDIEGQNCSKICGKDYSQEISSVECCRAGQGQANCKMKAECASDFIAAKQEQINVQNKKLNYYFGLEILFSAMTIIFICRICTKAPTRRRQNQLQRRAAIARLILHLNIWQDTNRQVRSSMRRSLLSESYISDDKGEICAVCLDSFQEEEVVKLACRHTFHRKCVEEWIQYNTTCPICRAQQ